MAGDKELEARFEALEAADTDSIIAKTEQKHGPCEWFEFEDGDLIGLAKPPNAHIEYKRFVDAVADKDASKGEAQETLVLACVVHPENQAQARQLLQKWPASLTDMTHAASDLMAGGVKRLGKGQKRQKRTT